MNSITLKNFRCFRDEQTVRLAPLTLLVGENSTGKTSFMAMIRMLWNVCYQTQAPDFKEEPYDLGSFDEIAHYRGGKGGRAESFEAGFDFNCFTPGEDTESQSCRFDVAFGKNGSAPVFKTIKFECDSVWHEIHYYEGQPQEMRFGTPNGSWNFQLSRTGSASPPDHRSHFFWFDSFARDLEILKNQVERLTNKGPLKPTGEDLDSMRQLARTFLDLKIGLRGYRSTRPYAGSPVRSKPRRTYDPARPTPDPEGDYIPMYLASLSHPEKKRPDPSRWKLLKKALEEFGKKAGLFDEIDIRHLGKRDSEPFQLQVRKSGNRAKSPKGPPRNLIDVGYGVSQVLPVITELLKEEEKASSMFLLQQPEVHLHPIAQAALGSLFCEVANADRQLIVETHSDYLLDRVRMDVRDGVSDLRPDDVSVLFFERNDLDIRIHSLKFDAEGNVIDAPDSYGKFFMEETRRSLWKH